MAYKKYIKRDGKLYGPYVYQSKRVDGKVVSEYCGTSKPDYKKIMLFIFGILILIALVSSFFIFKGKLTGNVISDNQLSSQTENTLVSESETINYPIVYFTLISRQTITSSDNQSLDENTLINDSNIVIDNHLDTPINNTEDSSNAIIQEPITEIQEEPILEEQPTETSQEPSATITEGVVSQMLETVSNFFLGLKLTGNVVSESGPIEINGQVSVDKPFIYTLKEGETIQILSGSVKTNSKLLSDDTIKIVYENSNVVVSTDYFESFTNVPNEEKIVINEPKIIEVPIKNETPIEFIETVFLTEQEKQILLTQFGNISVQTIKSELFNGRYIVGYAFGEYNLESSYDSDLTESTLKFQMEKDRIRWLKNIANKLLEIESVHTEANQFNLNFPL